MIPTIGIMVGAYIALRCIEIASHRRDQFISKPAGIIVTIAAILVLIVTVFAMGDLARGSRSTTTNGISYSAPLEDRVPARTMTDAELSSFSERNKREVDELLRQNKRLTK